MLRFLAQDDDFNNATPRKTAASIFGPGMGGAAGAGGGMFGAPPPPLDMDTGPSNMGKVGDACELCLCTRSPRAAL